MERILLETDSPYMVPRNAYHWLERRRLGEKKRFGISHAGMIPFIAEKIAEWINEGRKARGEMEEIGIEEVLDITRGNAGRMFQIEV